MAGWSARRGAAHRTCSWWWVSPTALAARSGSAVFRAQSGELLAALGDAQHQPGVEQLGVLEHDGVGLLDAVPLVAIGVDLARDVEEGVRLLFHAVGELLAPTAFGVARGVHGGA